MNPVHSHPRSQSASVHSAGSAATVANAKRAPNA